MDRVTSRVWEAHDLVPAFPGVLKKAYDTKPTQSHFPAHFPCKFLMYDAPERSVHAQPRLVANFDLGFVVNQSIIYNNYLKYVRRSINRSTFRPFGLSSLFLFERVGSACLTSFR